MAVNLPSVRLLKVLNCVKAPIRFASLLRNSESFKVIIEDNGLCTLKINRPSKKNAFTLQMFNEWVDITRQVSQENRVRLLAVTGEGDMFTAGNDQHNIVDHYDPSLSEAELHARGQRIVREHIACEPRHSDYSDVSFQTVACCVWNPVCVCVSASRPFMRALLVFPKPLVALANGPGIGIGLSLLPHCDLVLAARGAWFSAPFSRLGIVPEAGSSFLFPLLVGRATTTRLLLLGERATSEQLYELGLVSHLLPPPPAFEAEAHRFLVENVLSLPPNALQLGRQLLHAHQRQELERALELECEYLARTWLSQETGRIAREFYAKRQPKKTS